MGSQRAGHDWATEQQQLWREFIPLDSQRKLKFLTMDLKYIFVWWTHLSWTSPSHRECEWSCKLFLKPHCLAAEIPKTRSLAPSTATEALRRIRKGICGTSLVVQWLRIHLAMKRTQVLSLIRELRFHMWWGNQTCALQRRFCKLPPNK